MVKCKILPFPEGKTFAVSFVDDTDLSTRENTEPVYDLLHSLEMRGTKTVWTLQQKRASAFRDFEETRIVELASGSTLQDREYLRFVLELKKKGFEIGLHGVSGGNSYRPEIIDGLDRFREIFGEYPRVNTFHAQNRENLYAGWYKLEFWPFRLAEKLTHNSDYQGHVQGSPYFWGDVAKRSIKYTRLPFHTIRNVNTLKINPSMPFHDPRRPYVNYWFGSSDGSDCESFKRLLCGRNVNQLRRENGVCLIYTHFAKGFVRKRDGRDKLDQGFVDTVTKISKDAGGWFPTASDLLDRLLLFKSLRVYQKEDSICIHNSGRVDCQGLTVLAHGADILKASGCEVLTSGDDNGLIIKNIPAGSTASLKVAGRFEIVNTLVSDSMPRRERLRLEFSNYHGLIRRYLRK